ncbi:hypothetical protein PoB_003185100 [Plakobranchus ocellatus]|uniref:Uncharacterized protein n=1 Tax=Plakobranchus ocellatus TaxID=259542 RepID=A0AAV4AAI7_9GAST|nr:hypothetical protein PoB_003185100 [Plakobranchus ocellatus]
MPVDFVRHRDVTQCGRTFRSQDKAVHGCRSVAGSIDRLKTSIRKGGTITVLTPWMSLPHILCAPPLSMFPHAALSPPRERVTKFMHQCSVLKISRKKVFCSGTSYFRTQEALERSAEQTRLSRLFMPEILDELPASEALPVYSERRAEPSGALEPR